MSLGKKKQKKPETQQQRERRETLERKRSRSTAIFKINGRSLKSNRIERQDREREFADF